MTRRSILRKSCALLALLLLLPLLSACEYHLVTIRIADFESALVDGVRFWRLTEGSWQYQPSSSLEFGALEVVEGEEVVGYTIVASDGYEVVTLPATVVRDPANPDDVTLEVQFLRAEEPGWFRVTTFNAAGESPLSLEQLYL